MDKNIKTENILDIPEDVKKWNWGAFLLTWLWALSHNVYIGLIALLPPFQLPMAIVLAVKGGEWAWKNRKFKNIEHYKEVQRKWTMWGFFVVIIQFVIFLIFILFYVSTLLKLLEGNLV